MKRMVLALVLGMVAAGGVQAQDVTLTGYWHGTYDCAQGLTGVNLTIRQGFGTAVEAVFHFYAVPQNPGVPTGCFRMTGRHDPYTHAFSLVSDESQWIVHPPDYLVVNFQGTLGVDGRSMRGRVEGPGCTSFDLQRLERPPLAPPSCTTALNISGMPHAGTVSVR
jgi:hypothetical protein